MCFVLIVYYLLVCGASDRVSNKDVLLYLTVFALNF